MGDTGPLEARVVTPRRATAAQLALVSDTRTGRWDVRKGITAPAEFRLVRARDAGAMRAG